MEEVLRVPLQKNKWLLLLACAKQLSYFILTFLLFLTLFCKKIVFFATRRYIFRRHRSILFITLCYYYFKASIYLFICVDIHLNPGPNFEDSFFKFCHWNCNSLKAHNFSRISSIQAYNAIHNLNLIAISETALTNDIDDEKIEIPGYLCLRNDLPPLDTHGGVLIYHKIDLRTKRRPDLESLPNLLVAELTISKKKVFFVLVYRKFGQTSEEFDIYITKMNELLSNIESEDPYCTILTGDFNAHLSGWWEGDTDDNFGIMTNQTFL